MADARWVHPSRLRLISSRLDRDASDDPDATSPRRGVAHPRRPTDRHRPTLPRWRRVAQDASEDSARKAPEGLRGGPYAAGHSWEHILDGWVFGDLEVRQSLDNLDGDRLSRDEFRNARRPSHTIFDPQLAVLTPN